MISAHSPFSGVGTTCVDPSTVFVTVPAPTTVYVTIIEPCIQVPGTTVTHLSTFHSTVYLTLASSSLTEFDPAEPSSSAAGNVVTPPVPSPVVPSSVSAEFTITQYSVVTVTRPYSVPTSSVSSGGSFGFIVNNGTTIWLDGTPTASTSFVIVTSAVTVLPLDPSQVASLTSTLTLHTTIYQTPSGVSPSPSLHSCLTILNTTKNQF